MDIPLFPVFFYFCERSFRDGIFTHDRIDEEHRRKNNALSAHVDLRLPVFPSPAQRLHLVGIVHRGIVPAAAAFRLPGKHGYGKTAKDVLGRFLNWSQLRDSNPGPVLYESTEQKCNKLPYNRLDEVKKSGTGQRTVSLDKPYPSDSNRPPLELSADLAEIAALWPQLPDPVRVGVLAMIKAAIGKA